MSLRLRAGQIQQEITALAGKRWMQYLGLAVITLLAAGLRFYRLGEWSFWIDEIFTINHAMSHFSTIELLLKNIPPSRNWIPVSVILDAQALKLWGVTEWSARLAPALIGVLTIPILYFPTKKLFNPHIALISVLLLTVSAWHIFWSQNARFYTSLMLFYTLALFAFHFGIEQDKPGYLFIFFFFAYLATSERFSALFIFPVVVIYLAALWLLRFEKPKGMNIRNLLIITVPLLIGGLIEFYSRIVNGESRFLVDFTWFFQYRNDDPIRLLGNITFNIGIPLMTLALFSSFFLILRRHRAGLLMTVNAVVPLAMIVAANPFIFTKDRYVFMALFSWMALAAVAIYELFAQTSGRHKWLAVGVLALLLMDAGGDALLYYRTNHGNRAEWKTAFSIIEEQSHPEDIVVAYWPEFGPFYLDREFIQYEDIDVPTLLNSGRRYWFVIDAETIQANPEVVSFLESDARLVDVRYLRTPDDFYLKIYFYDPNQPLPR
jgi:4-amino-4-deoxy-L-arabinose transferase-like glycosyltransferase